jgi:phosphatidylserine decarboxylase
MKDQYLTNDILFSKNDKNVIVITTNISTTMSLAMVSAMVAIIISSFLFKKLHYNNAPRLLSPSPP